MTRPSARPASADSCTYMSWDVSSLSNTKQRISAVQPRGSSATSTEGRAVERQGGDWSGLKNVVGERIRLSWPEGSASCLREWGEGFCSDGLPSRGQHLDVLSAPPGVAGHQQCWGWVWRPSLPRQELRGAKMPSHPGRMNLDEYDRFGGNAARTGGRTTTSKRAR